MSLRQIFSALALLFLAQGAPGAQPSPPSPEADPLVSEAVASRSYVLAEFTSQTCPACDEMRPIVQVVLARHPGLRHQLHDADLEVELSKKYKVRCVPVYVVVDPEGIIRFNDVGIWTAEELDEILLRAGVR